MGGKAIVTAWYDLGDDAEDGEKKWKAIEPIYKPFGGFAPNARKTHVVGNGRALKTSFRIGAIRWGWDGYLEEELSNMLIKKNVAGEDEVVAFRKKSEFRSEKALSELSKMKAAKKERKARYKKSRPKKG